MTTEAQLRDELHEARTAKRLRNDILGDFFKEKEAQLFEAFTEVRIGDTESLVHIHHQFKSLNALKAEIQTVLNTGKMAEAELAAAEEAQALDKAGK